MSSLSDWTEAAEMSARRTMPGPVVIDSNFASAWVEGPGLLTPVTGVDPAAQATNARTVVPTHYEGWSHFRTPRSEIDSTFRGPQ